MRAVGKWNELFFNLSTLKWIIIIRSRSQGDDQEKALQILEGICQANRHEHELSNDITCLIGRIYKDKYTSSKCQSPEMLENAIDWYRRGFADDPNV